MLIDYHVHNHFSPDSHADTRKIVDEATKKGIQEICITNHPENHDYQASQSRFDLKEASERFKAIKDEIDEVQAEFPTIRINFGVEVEYQAERMKTVEQWIKEMPFDLVLGSVHMVNGIAISSHKYADSLYSKTDEKTAYETYFRELDKLVEWGQMDVVAHFDICKKYGVRFYGPFQPERYRHLIIPVLKKMAQKSIGLEINTKCVTEKCHETFPHPLILKWAVQEGIKIFTLGSDAHEPKEVGQSFKSALNTALESGITAIATYHNRKPALNAI